MKKTIQEYRLKNIHKKWNYFIKEIDVYTTVYTTLNYIENFLF